MTSEEFDKLWKSLNEPQKQRVKDKAKWEHMSLWAICNEWPGIWDVLSEAEWDTEMCAAILKAEGK